MSSAAAPRREERHDDGGASDAAVARAVIDPEAEVARFAEVWQRRVASPPSPDAHTVYGELRRRYEEPFRRYHNVQHIQDCLRLCDEIGPLLVDRDAVEIALWFHDAVYDRGSSTNELRSAELFLSMSAGASFMFRHRVCDHILATRHSTTVRDPDRRFLVAALLAQQRAVAHELVPRRTESREIDVDQDDVR